MRRSRGRFLSWSRSWCEGPKRRRLKLQPTWAWRTGFESRCRSWGSSYLQSLELQEGRALVSGPEETAWSRAVPWACWPSAFKS